jgi:hypothetical protein
MVPLRFSSRLGSLAALPAKPSGVSIVARPFASGVLGHGSDPPRFLGDMPDPTGCVSRAGCRPSVRTPRLASVSSVGEQTPPHVVNTGRPQPWPFWWRAATGVHELHEGPPLGSDPHGRERHSDQGQPSCTGHTAGGKVAVCGRFEGDSERLSTGVHGEGGSVTFKTTDRPQERIGRLHGPGKRPRPVMSSISLPDCQRPLGSEFPMIRMRSRCRLSPDIPRFALVSIAQDQYRPSRLLPEAFHEAIQQNGSHAGR